MDFAKRIQSIAVDLFSEYTPELTDNGAISPDAAVSYMHQSLGNVFGRTGLIFTNVEYELPSADFRLKNKGEESEQTTFACPSSKINFDFVKKNSRRKSDLLPVSIIDDCTVLQPRDEEVTKAWHSARIKELTAAINAEPDYIVFPELSYPIRPTPVGSALGIDSITNCYSGRSTFEKDVLDVMHRNSSTAFLVLGSYHCINSLYNVGVIYPLGSIDQKISAIKRYEFLGGAVRETKKIELDPPILYKKRFPARRVGENTRVPAHSEFDIYQTPKGHVAVMICSDILDLNQFGSIIRRNLSTTYDDIDAVLIPTFNSSRKLLAMCRELSFLANTVVVTCNASGMHSSKGVPESDIFICGRDKQQLSAAGVIDIEPLKSGKSKLGEIYRCSNREIRRLIQETLDNRPAFFKAQSGLQRAKMRPNS